MVLKEGDPLWAPSAAQIESSRLAAFMAWLSAERALRFEDYASLWRWSANDLDDFWSAVWDFFGIQAAGAPQPVLASRDMPGARWFPNARVNYAEHVFRHASRDRPALL